MKIELAVRYVVMAMTSNIRGERKFGHKPIGLGIGKLQCTNHTRPTCTITNRAAVISENSVMASALR
jgi:hypothetical protein